MTVGFNAQCLSAKTRPLLSLRRANNEDAPLDGSGQQTLDKTARYTLLRLLNMRTARLNYGVLSIRADTTETSHKIWVCLYTCGSTRAIHLDHVSELSAESFLCCLRRFVAQFGQPKEILSDNAPQFRLSDRTLELAWRQILTDDSVFDYCATTGIKWKFITEYAPWQGGFWERLIGIVKSCMKKSIGRKTLTRDGLSTLLCEVSAVVNSRPLTFLYDDTESGVPLRPIDFLRPEGKIGTPVLRDREDDPNDPDYILNPSSKDKLLQQWKIGQVLLDKFWDLWQSEYLLSLRERHNLSHKHPKGSLSQQPKIGEIVMIHDDTVMPGV